MVVNLQPRHCATETNTHLQDDLTAKVLSLGCFVQLHSSSSTATKGVLSYTSMLALHDFAGERNGKSKDNKN